MCFKWSGCWIVKQCLQQCLQHLSYIAINRFWLSGTDNPPITSTSRRDYPGVQSWENRQDLNFELLCFFSPHTIYLSLSVCITDCFHSTTMNVFKKRLSDCAYRYPHLYDSSPLFMTAGFSSRLRVCPCHTNKFILSITLRGVNRCKAARKLMLKCHCKLLSPVATRWAAIGETSPRSNRTSCCLWHPMSWMTENRHRKQSTIKSLSETLIYSGHTIIIASYFNLKTALSWHTSYLMRSRWTEETLVCIFARIHQNPFIILLCYISLSV